MSQLKDATEDRHQVRVRVSQEDEQVLLAFGELVGWVSLPPLAAIELADHIRDTAEDVLRSDA
jgi:hypothetical protein